MSRGGPAGARLSRTLDPYGRMREERLQKASPPLSEPGRPTALHARSLSDSAEVGDVELSAFDLRPLGLSSASPWPEVQLSPRPPRSTHTSSPPSSQHWPSLDFGTHTTSPADPVPDGVSVAGGGEYGLTSSTSNPTFYSDRERDAAVGAASPAMTSVPPQAHKRAMDDSWMGGNGKLSFLVHWWGLAFCEFPMTHHRQWLGVTQRPRTPQGTEGTLGGEASRGRGGKLKRRLLMGMGAAHRRFVPLDNLEEQYASNRKRRRLMYALRRHHTPGSYRGRWDAFCNEAFIACQLCFDLCTPKRLRSHPPWFTAAFLALICVTFAFMAGEYPAYMGSHAQESGARACLPQAFNKGPAGLAAWVWNWDGCHSFDSDFLVLWGASYAPKVNQAKEWWRWASSLLLANSFAHAAGNALLFGVLGLHLECRYSTTVVAIITVLSGLGGNFFDASFRGECTVIISGAGCTFGLLGLFVADFALNFESVRYPFLRLASFAIALTLFILSMVLLGYPYRLTPLGGFLTGLFPSLLFLPHIKTEVFEWCIPLVSLVTCVGFLLALPLYIYLVRFPGAECP